MKQIWHLLSGTHPSAAEDVEILNGTIDFTTSSLLLDIGWKLPFPYGKLIAYNLILTAEFDNGNETYNLTLANEYFPVSLVCDMMLFTYYTTAKHFIGQFKCNDFIRC